MLDNLASRQWAELRMRCGYADQLEESIHLCINEWRYLNIVSRRRVDVDRMINDMILNI